MNRLYSALAVLTVLSVTGTSVSAAPIDPFNTRPVPVGSTPADEQDLTPILQTIFAGSGMTSANQNSAGMWSFAAFPSSLIPTLAFEYTAGAASQAFGIWFGSDTNALFTYDIFTGAATGVNNGTATAAGVQVSGNNLVVFGANCVQVNCTPVGGVNNGLVGNTFGFYLRTGGNTFYTVDQLNGGQARSLAFLNGSSTNWALAFEDGTGGANGLGDFDYNDAVIKLESMTAATPVPEPGSMLLLGSGLVALANKARRRFGKNARAAV